MCITIRQNRHFLCLTFHSNRIAQHKYTPSMQRKLERSGTFSLIFASAASIFCKRSRISVAIYTIFHFSNIYVVSLNGAWNSTKRNPTTALYWFGFCVFCLFLSLSPFACYSRNIHMRHEILNSKNPSISFE